MQWPGHKAKAATWQTPKAQSTLLYPKDLPDGIHEAKISKQIMTTAISLLIDSLPQMAKLSKHYMSYQKTTKNV